MRHKRALILTLLPYKFGTRAKKGAASLSMRIPTRYLAPARVGRSKLWDRPGAWSENANLSVHQVDVRTARTEPRVRNQLWNIFVVYVPALAKLLREALKFRADIMLINGTSLLPVGIIHHVVFKSRLVLDINERPGQVNTKGSIAAWFSRLEVAMLRLFSRYVSVALVVTYADVDVARKLGFRRVALVRNVPQSEWRASFTMPPFSRSEEGEAPLRLLAMGTIYEGRGYELMIRSVALLEGSQDVRLTLCGPGRDSYIEHLQELAQAFGVEKKIDFVDRIDPSEVSRMYLAHDVGLVIYEAADPGNDGLSNKLFECVASGRPVIASGLPENRRFVSESGVGWLTDNTPEDLASKILRAAQPQKLADVALRCRAMGDEDLHWDGEFMRALESLLEG